MDRRRLAGRVDRRRLAGLVALLAALLLAAPPAARALAPDFRIRVGEPPGPAPPVFSEGRAWFVDADGRVHAIDTVRGREVWEASVRCGRDAFTLHRGHLACATGARARVLVLSAKSGRLIARQRLEGGPYSVTAVAGVLVFHDQQSGRLIGYDVGRRTWTFDHGTEADPAPADAYAPLTLGSRYLFTEEEYRTLRAVDVRDGRLHVVARAATPVRIDRGRAARITHGLVLSHGRHGVQAFEIATAKRRWRLELDRLTGEPDARVEAVASDGDRVLVLAVVPGAASGVATSAGAAAGARWPVALVVGLRDGAVRALRSLAWDAPFAALPYLAAPQDERCAVARFAAPVLAGERAAVAITGGCDPRRTPFPLGVVVGFPAVGPGAAWASPPRTADRLLAEDGALYGLWGREGVLHAERTAVALDPEDGVELGRALVGYTPTWARVHADQLWVGTTAGTVVVFRR